MSSAGVPDVDRLASAIAAMDADELDERWVTSLVLEAANSGPLPSVQALLSTDGEEVDAKVTEREILAALFQASPRIIDLLGFRHVADDVVAQTMADFGRHLRRHRRFTGRPGLLNWRWFRVHLRGTMINVGRLQFEVHRSPVELESIAGSWVVRIHIPADSGPLTANAVDESLQRGAEHIRGAWPEIPITHAVCDSWLMDPYLAAHRPGSNIAAFADRFSPYASPVDEPTDPLFFLWGHRDLTRLPTEGLSRLERVVVDRIEAKGLWQSGRGFLELPDSRE